MREDGLERVNLVVKANQKEKDKKKHGTRTSTNGKEVYD